MDDNRDDWRDSSTGGDSRDSTIANCGHIPNLSDLEFVYQCFYDSGSLTGATDCEENEELYNLEICYYSETGIDLMDPFYDGAN